MLHCTFKTQLLCVSECPLSICWAVQLGFYLVLISKKQIWKMFLQWKILMVKLIAPLPHGFQDNCVPCDWEEGEILMWFIIDIEMDIWVYFSVLCFAYARWFKFILFLLFSHMHWRNLISKRKCFSLYAALIHSVVVDPPPWQSHFVYPDSNNDW